MPPFTDICDSPETIITRSARANLSRAALGDVIFTLQGFALGLDGYDPTNPVKIQTLVDPTGIATANIVIVNNSFDANDKVVVNGTDFEVGVEWSAGADTAESATNLAEAINNVFNIDSKRIIFATVSSSTIYLYSTAPGQLGNSYTLSKVDHATLNFNISGGTFTEGKNGCGGVDGGLGNKIYPNGDILSPANPSAIDLFNITSGIHDGPIGSTLSDSTKSWSIDAYVGNLITNVTDGSKGLVTSNTASAIYATLSGGVTNQWNVGDAYLVGIEQPNPMSVSALCRLSRAGSHNYGYGSIATYAKITQSRFIPAEIGEYFMFAIGNMPIQSKNERSVFIFRIISQL